MFAQTVLAAGPVIPTFQKPSDCLSNNGSFCTDYITSHWGSTFEPALLEHIGMSVVATGIGFAISFVLAILAHFVGILVKPITFLGSLLYTIPSIAAFEILLPITGTPNI